MESSSSERQTVDALQQGNLSRDGGQRDAAHAKSTHVNQRTKSQTYPGSVGGQCDAAHANRVGINRDYSDCIDSSETGPRNPVKRPMPDHVLLEGSVMQPMPEIKYLFYHKSNSLI